MLDKVLSFIKGIFVGIGGITPGLSGSVLMIALGLYTNVITAIANLFKDFKKNFFYLLPIGLGIIVGIVFFSRFTIYLLNNHEIQTRMAFLGLLIGTIPLFYKEVKRKKDIKRHHYYMTLFSFVLGFYFLFFSNITANIDVLGIPQAFMLGFVGISATVVPGIDGAATMSALGLYHHWLNLTSLSNIDLAIYIPAGCGVLIGVLLLSNLINRLLKKSYTGTFAILFGFYLSIIPSILRNRSGQFVGIGANEATYIGIGCLLLGILISYVFSKLSKNN